MKRNVFAVIGCVRWLARTLALLGCFTCTQIGFAQLSLPPQQPIVGARMPALIPEGKQLSVVYGRYGFHWTRPRYHGSAAGQIWLLDVAAKKRRALTTDNFQHLWTRFMPDNKHLLTVTVAEETPSVSTLALTIPPIVDNPK